MRDLIVLGGLLHPQLTRAICRNLTLDQTEVSLRKFKNGETSIEIAESMRGKDVFIVQSGCGHVNDNLMELLITIAACKTASARRVTAVLPLFPYSRQPDVPHAASATGAPSIAPKKEVYTYDSVPGTPTPLSRASSVLGVPRKGPSAGPVGINTGGFATSTEALAPVDATGRTHSGYKQWIAQNGTLIANLVTTAGADRCITMDLHDPQFEGFFNIPVDNLYLKPLLKHYITDYIPDYRECVIVSPDSGGAKRATNIADALGCSFALIHKERRALVAKNPPSTAASGHVAKALASVPIATTILVGDVKDRVCVLVDDLVDTSYTITRAAKLLKDQGAKYVYALVTHGVFSGDAINRIDKSAVDRLITTNSVPQTENMAKLGDKLEVLDVSRVLAEAIRRIHNGESVSMLFDHGW